MTEKNWKVRYKVVLEPISDYYEYEKIFTIQQDQVFLVDKLRSFFFSRINQRLVFFVLFILAYLQKKLKKVQLSENK